MEYRQLGDSGLEVSTVSLGSWLTYGGAVDADIARACVRRALDLGVNLIDTANAYATGGAESFLGDQLHGVPRGDYVLATKVFFPMSEEDKGLSAAQVRKQLEASLRRLQVDYVDLYQCHRYDPDVPLEETMDALTEAVISGKARAIGFSEWSPQQVRDEAIGFLTTDAILEAVQRFRVVADETGLTPAQLALAWVLREPNVSSAITGATRPSQVEENVAASGIVLDDDTVQAIDDALGEAVM